MGKLPYWGVSPPFGTIDVRYQHILLSLHLTGVAEIGLQGVQGYLTTSLDTLSKKRYVVTVLS